ncbi:hypothetical protein HMPREF9630_00560 [Peptoanaerobacter stomatis]|uniref:Phage head-tail adaptor n=1 Tax=Peptoanaerobacter stomatis TaxID=796937 RepID=V9HUK5_9FIRM|nr:phage head closure protein [Peptoanaerobacter stomatis]EHL17393.1 hypothetical protein HMPREF9630_00560 [Peptoanaerobacter stomatis]
MFGYNNEIILISKEITTDDNLIEQETEIEKSILCREKSVNRDEFYKAGAQGFKLGYIVIVHSFEYNGEDKAIYKGKSYDILKTYQTGVDEIELTLSQKVGV